MYRSVSLILMLVYPTLLAADEGSTYRWLRDVDLPEITATTLVAIPLDSHVFLSTRNGWPDVRLKNDRNDSVAFLVRAAHDTKTGTVREFWSAKQDSARVDSTDGLRVELSLRDKDPAPLGVRIVSPLRDFEHQVRVEVPSDGESWIAAGPPNLIFDYSRFVDARNDLVPFEPGNYRRFRLTIDDVTAEQESQLKELHRRLRGSEEIDRAESTTIIRRPFRIDRIDFYRDTSKAENVRTKTIDYSATNVNATENRKDHQTVVRFDTQREPITGVTINTTADNFSREARVEVELEDENGKSSWKSLANGTLTRFSVGSTKRDERTLTIPETQALHYRVVIENRDSPPLSVEGLELKGPLYELVFLASRDDKLRLEYGSPESKAGRFDTAALQAHLSQAQPPLSAKWQQPRENENAPPATERAWKPWNENRILLGMIVAFTLLLGWGLYQAGRRIDTTPPE